MSGEQITNALTIDVEDYFQVSAFAPHIARADWNTLECRVERNVDRILGLLDKHGTKATFFTLGWLAERQVQATFFTLGWIAQRYPHVVRQIVAGGHELASHGYGHERASDQSESAFFADVQLAKLLLEDLSGVEVKGYRAPSFSIGSGNQWAFDCLERAGYRYSSSIYPIKHDHYGMPDSPRFAYRVGAGLLEIPVTTVRKFKRNLPSSGGGYFRLLPYSVSRWLLRQVNQQDHEPAIFYFHPWEIDVGQPRIAGINAKTRFRHYVNIPRTEGRLQNLLRDFRWGRMDHIFLHPGVGAQAPLVGNADNHAAAA
jgi:polysaccharide deacetylase family protein (PEP-CTERM system associated)